MKRTVVLLILDGWGIGKNNQSNPLYIRKPKLLNYLPNYYLAGSLQAFGVAVGLPWFEEANSEVGHLTIGAGRIVYQHYLRINNAVKDGSFFKNQALFGAIAHAKKNNSALNLAGLLTEGSVHASFEHLEALLELAKTNGILNVNLHLFSDGKDSAPKSVLKLLEKLGTASQLASVSGRHYALDRDGHYDRTEKAYQAITGTARVVDDIPEEIQRFYDRDFNDQQIEPFSVGPSPRGVRDGDALIFFDFREDSVRQIVEPFVVPGFNKFQIQPIKNLYVATMTHYSDKFKIPVAFPPE